MKLPGNKIKFIQLTLGLLISGFCLWLALRHVPYDSLAQTLSRADYLWITLALLAQFGSVLARAERWRVLLGPPVNLKDTFWAQGIGFLFTNVLPFRLGEPARVAALSGRSRLPLAQVAATAIVERLLDVATIVLVLAGILPLMQVPVEVQQAGLFLGLLAGLGLVFTFGLAWQRKRSELLIRSWSSRLLPRYAEAITARWGELLSGFAALTRGPVAGLVLFWSLVAWACSIGVYWTILRAFQPAATAVEAAFMLAALALAITVPSGPGFIGVFQWVGQQALVLPFGDKYSLANALAITLIAYLVYYLFTTLLGVIGLWQFGQSFAQLQRLLAGRQAPVPSEQVKIEST